MLDCSSRKAVSTLASHQGETGFNTRPGHTRNFATGDRAGQCRWSAGFSGISRFPPPLHTVTAPSTPHFILIGSQDLDVKSRPNLFTHLLSQRVYKYREKNVMAMDLILAVRVSGKGPCFSLAIACWEMFPTGWTAGGRVDHRALIGGRRPNNLLACTIGVRYVSGGFISTLQSSPRTRMESWDVQMEEWRSLCSAAFKTKQWFVYSRQTVVEMRPEAAVVLGLWLAFGGGAGAAPDAADLLRELLKEPFAPGSGGESLGNVSLDCLQHGRVFLRELANGTSWAVRRLGKRETPEKTRLARFPRVKIRARPRRESNPVRLGGWRALYPLHYRGPKTAIAYRQVGTPLASQRLGTCLAVSRPANREGCVTRNSQSGKRIVPEPFTVSHRMVFDASAKVPAGLLTNSGDVIGNYDQCLEVFAPSQGFYGQYCTASIACLNCAPDTNFPGSQVSTRMYWLQSGGPPEATGYQVGLCVPSSCSSRDVEEHLGDLLMNWSLRTDVHAVADLRPNDCHTARSDNRAYVSADYAFLAVMALIAALLIIGTGYDVYLKRNPPKDAEIRNFTAYLRWVAVALQLDHLLHTKANRVQLLAGPLPGISRVGIESDDADDWWVYSEFSRFSRYCIPALFNLHLASSSEVSMEQHRNVRAGETGYPRESPPTGGIVRYDSLVRKSGSDPAGDRTRFASMRGEQGGGGLRLCAGPTASGHAGGFVRIPVLGLSRRGAVSVGAEQLTTFLGSREDPVAVGRRHAWPLAFVLAEGGNDCRTALLAFSVRTNAPPLFDTSSPDGSLVCINGIRFLSIAWVVVFHVHAAVYRTPRTNADQTSRVSTNTIDAQIMRREHGAVPEMKRRGKPEIPEKTRRPVVSSGMIPTCENSGVDRLGIEPGSPWWEASSLTAQPTQPRNTEPNRSTKESKGNFKTSQFLYLILQEEKMHKICATMNFKQSWYMMIMMNGSLSTDTFLLIGGVLLAYIFMRDRKKNHSFNIVTFYIHRYIRVIEVNMERRRDECAVETGDPLENPLTNGIVRHYSHLRKSGGRPRRESSLVRLGGRRVVVTPAYAVVIFFYATMLYHLGSGPLWDEFIKDERRKCVDWWYSNVLYVNNYNSNENTDAERRYLSSVMVNWRGDREQRWNAEVGEMGVLQEDHITHCIVQSWYLATDMQFYWLSPLILYPLWRWPKAGWTLLIAALVASTTALMAVTASYSGQNFSRWYEDNWNLTYTPVYTRAGPYLIGLALGYLLQVIRKDFAMSKYTYRHTLDQFASRHNPVKCVIRVVWCVMADDSGGRMDDVSGTARCDTIRRIPPAAGRLQLRHHRGDSARWSASNCLVCRASLGRLRMCQGLWR
ncbi:hypothetical protein PR048_022393 [Dryococelus australis]|uniref:Nose resistant-to-fluoxetine protein N-terminal domain-containing protein n=1 Tax=Dryococelus australis TaxID=614101 RepID=A0ABQ9H0V6_9NEOP|nr:hypothetical protein PR048_022393 [Dryococelus australis]